MTTYRPKGFDAKGPMSPSKLECVGNWCQGPDCLLLAKGVACVIKTSWVLCLWVKIYYIHPWGKENKRND